MNKRICELAEQAGFEITPWRNELLPCVHQEGPVHIQLEKFAELIVRECAHRSEELGQPEIGKGLMKHFGVEE